MQQSDVMMDTIKAMQVFVRIAEQGSLSRAAEQLNYSRAMVSRYLDHLEQTFSVRLFQRNTRKISLTPAGEKLYCIVKIFYSSRRYCLNWLRMNNKQVQSVSPAVYFYIKWG